MNEELQKSTEFKPCDIGKTEYPEVFAQELIGFGHEPGSEVCHLGKRM